MEKVMVLGAGRGQIPVMNLCHKYGLFVIAVSKAGDYPGFCVADKKYYIDVSDTESIIEIAEKEQIKAILTDQLDEGVHSAAIVAERLGLRGISKEVALKFTNKFIMRQCADKLGIPVPRFSIVHSVEEIRSLLKSSSILRYPLIMKPADSSASKGIYKIESLKEAEEKFSESIRYSHSGGVIIEQFIEGVEFVVDAYTHDYETTNLIVGHRDYFQIPGTFIPNATVFTDAESANNPVEKKLKEINQKLVKGFGLSYGITHGEYMYNKKEDRIYLVEIAARGGGVFISSDLIPSASGIDANDLLVRDNLGLDISWPISLKNGAAAYFCYLLPKGTVTEIKGTEEVEKTPGVMKAFFDNVHLGMTVSSITDKSSRKGPILIRGNSKAECYRICEEIKKKLYIEVTDGEYVNSLIWHDVCLNKD